MKLLLIYLESGCITAIPEDFELSYFLTLLKYWVASYFIAILLSLQYTIPMFIIAYLIADYFFFREVVLFHSLLNDAGKASYEEDDE